MKRAFEIPEALYPFKSHWIEVEGIPVHYLDEGQGDVILFCHGNPTYSLLYAGIIQILRENFRCIAPDYPGFGFSGKPPLMKYGYKPKDHFRILHRFVDALKLDHFSIFVQDWGGPIGLGVAGEIPERISRLFIGNTWAWPLDQETPAGRSACEFSEKMSGESMRDKILTKNAFLSFSLPLLLRGVKKRNPNLANALKEAYCAPFPDRDSRMPMAILPREIVASREYLAKVVLVLLISPMIPTWKNTLPSRNTCR